MSRLADRKRELVSRSDEARLRIAEDLGVARSAGAWVDRGCQRARRIRPFLIYLAPEITDADANTYRLALSCDAGCDRGYTRHPLVLMHGAAGTDAFLDVLDYWKDLDEALPASGYHVEIPAVAALDSVADRAVEWSAHLDALEAAGVGRRFNLIAHSLGGLDARYLVGGLGEGERIASITTIGTPHRGTVVADLYAGAVDLSLFDGILLDAVAEAMVSLIGLEGDELTAMIVDMSTAAMADFNDEILDDPDVYYRSWAGRSCSALDWTCQSETGGEVISSFFAATWSLIWLVEGDNDGLVSLDSAAWGDYRGELPVDHLGEVGWELDLLQADFDHVAFYLSEAEALAGEGL